MCTESLATAGDSRLRRRNALAAVVFMFSGFWLAGCGSSPQDARSSRLLSSVRGAGLTAIVTPSRPEGRSAAASVRAAAAVAGEYQFEFFDGTPAASSTTVYGLNDPSVAVGNYFSARHLHGLVWTKGTVQTVDVPFPGAIGTDWRAINDRGTIIGGWGDQDFFVHGAQRSASGTITRFDYPNAAETFPGGINDHGEIVGSHDEGDITGAGFLYRDGRFIDLPDVPQAPQQNYPAAINNAGVIAGNYLDGFDQSPFGISHGYILRDGNYATFDFPGSVYTYVNALNDLGQAVGFYDLADGSEEGFIFESGKNRFRTFSCPGAAFTDALAINNRGQVGGICATAAGFQGFVATPVHSGSGDE